MWACDYPHPDSTWPNSAGRHRRGPGQPRRRDHPQGDERELPQALRRSVAGSRELHVKFDMFSEAQRVGPRDETGLFRDLLEQARLADDLGFETWWVVEHHGAGEYSYSSTPELLLTWIATQTERIRLGHSGGARTFPHQPSDSRRRARRHAGPHQRRSPGVRDGALARWGVGCLRGGSRDHARPSSSKRCA